MFRGQLLKAVNRCIALVGFPASEPVGVFGLVHCPVGMVTGDSGPRLSLVCPGPVFSVYDVHAHLCTGTMELGWPYRAGARLGSWAAPLSRFLPFCPRLLPAPCPGRKCSAGLVSLADVSCSGLASGTEVWVDFTSAGKECRGGRCLPAACRGHLPILCHGARRP